jgi:hypothetical protein
MSIGISVPSFSTRNLIHNLQRSRLSPHRATIPSFIQVNRRVVDGGHLEVPGWLQFGVDELLEEEHCCLDESERFGRRAEKGVLFCLLQHGCRSFTSGDIFAPQMIWWGRGDRGRTGTARRSGTRRQRVLFQCLLLCTAIDDRNDHGRPRPPRTPWYDTRGMIQ